MTSSVRQLFLVVVTVAFCAINLLAMGMSQGHAVELDDLTVTCSSETATVAHDHAPPCVTADADDCGTADTCCTDACQGLVGVAFATFRAKTPDAPEIYLVRSYHTLTALTLDRPPRVRA